MKAPFVSVTIRDAGLEDVEIIAGIERQVSGRWIPEYWRELLSVSAYPMLTFCAEVDGEVAGFLFAQVRIGEHAMADEAGWLTNMGVAPDFRRRGVGRALVVGLVDRLREIGVPELWGLAPTGGSGFDFLQRARFELRSDLVPVRLAVGEPP